MSDTKEPPVRAQAESTAEMRLMDAFRSFKKLPTMAASESLGRAMLDYQKEFVKQFTNALK